MDDSSLWAALAALAAAAVSGVFAYRAKRQETTVAREAGYVGAYDRLVGNLEREISRLYDLVAELRADNDRLYAEVRTLRRERDGTPGGA